MANRFIDAEELKKALSILKPNNQLFEIRIIGDKTKSGYFTDVDLAIKCLENTDLYGCNVYFILNEIHDACYSRVQADKIIQVYKNPMTSDSNITKYEWLMIDLDPERPSGTSSSDAERAAAGNLALEIRNFLHELGFNNPIQASSGNGFHMLYRISLNNTDENKELVKNCLETLSALFSNESVKIDTSTHNPGQMCKLYGTAAQKGANAVNQGRPHRMSKIFSDDVEYMVNDVSLLQKLCEYLPKQEHPERISKPKSNYTFNFDVEKFLSDNNMEYHIKNETGVTKYLLAECPFNSEHKDKAAIFKYSNGDLGFKCQKGSCKDKYHWQDVRQKYADYFERNKATKSSCNALVKSNESELIVSNEQDLNFERDKQGHILQTIDNARIAIETDPELAGNIKYNDIAFSPVKIGPLPWDKSNKYREWTDFDDSYLRTFIEKKYGLKSKVIFDDALNNVCFDNRYNPITELLNSIYHNQWDKEYGHIRRLMPDYLGVDDNEYSYEVMKLFMLGAICRAHAPGTKFDYVPILVGPQGIGKSTFLRMLCMNPEWHDDNFNTIEGDKACEKLRGKWMVELAELLATKRAKEVESIKAFLTSTSDNYRAPWDKRTAMRPRACVFAGTTNNTQFLTDRTGNRRFLPIETNVHKPTKDIFSDDKTIADDIANAWGEAMDIYLKADKHPALVLPRSCQQIIQDTQERYLEEDPRVAIIQEYLENKYAPVCVSQLIVEALGLDNRDLNKRLSNEIHSIMENQIPGWKRSPKKVKIAGYGSMVAYKRNDMSNLSDDEN